MREVLRNRKFVFLWLSQVFTQLGSNTLTFILTLRVFELTHSNVAVGFLLLMFGLPTFLFGLIAGVLTDRLNKVKIIFFVNLIFFFLVTVFYLTSESLFFAFFLVFLFSLTLQMFFPSVASLIPIFVKEKELLSANSLFTLTLYTTVILGYVAAGPLLRFFGPRNIFPFVSIYFLISAFLIRKIGFQTDSRFSQLLKGLQSLDPFRDTSLVTEIATSLRQILTFIRDNLLVRRALLLLALSQLIITTLLSLSPGFASEVLKIDIAQSSIFVILPAALGMLLGSVYLGFFGKNWPRSKLVHLGLCLIFLSLLALSFTQFFTQRLLISPITISFLIIFVFGGANALLEVPSNTIIQEESKQFRGRIYGLLGTLVYGASLLPLILFGLIADRFGVSFVLFGISLVTFTAFLIT